MKTSKFQHALLVTLLFIFISGCSEKGESDASLSVNFEKYILQNGLHVILHQDHSDPIVSRRLEPCPCPGHRAAPRTTSKLRRKGLWQSPNGAG